MSKRDDVTKLLQANPAAKKDERVIREALKDIEALRRAGFGRREYELVVPFGDKRQLRADEGITRRYTK